MHNSKETTSSYIVLCVGCKCYRRFVLSAEDKIRTAREVKNRFGYQAFPTSDRALLICPYCDTLVSASATVGRRSDKKRCGKTCTHAFGSSCLCECAGANHGAAWDAASNLLEDKSR